MSAEEGALLSEESGGDWKFSSATSIERRIALKWTLEKFSLRPKNATIRSPSFHFLSFEWSLALHPNEKPICSLGYGYVNLHLRMENPKSETKVKAKMCLKDRNEDYYEQNFEYVFSAEKKENTCTLIKRLQLLEQRKLLLYDDVLTVYCEINGTQMVERGVDRSTTTDTEDLEVPKRIQVFMNDMETRLKDPKSCDATLRVGDKKFPAHKFLLGARSKVFAAMFDHDTEESRSGIVTITDIEARLVSDLLQYIYTSQVKDMSVDKAIGLYSAADKYDLLDLKEQCADFLMKNLSEENICGIAMMADTHNDGRLIDFIKVFIRENTSVLYSEQWKGLEEQNVRLAYEFCLSLNKVFISGNSVPSK